MKNYLRICAAMLAVAACSSSPPLFDEMVGTGNTGGLVPDSATRAVTLSAGPVPGRAVVRHMPQLASVAAGLPLVVPPQIPTVGEPFTLAFTTRPTAPFPDVSTALLVSFEPPGDAHAIPGARGGMLQVPLNPKLTFRPGDVDWLTQAGGVVRLDLTFAEQHAGLRIWCQLLVKDAVAGVLTSPVVALTVRKR